MRSAVIAVHDKMGTCYHHRGHRPLSKLHVLQLLLLLSVCLAIPVKSHKP